MPSRHPIDPWKPPPPIPRHPPLANILFPYPKFPHTEQMYEEVIYFWKEVSSRFCKVVSSACVAYKGWEVAGVWGTQFWEGDS